MGNTRSGAKRLIDRVSASPIDDPVVYWLRVAIGLSIVIAFVAVIYGLLTGVVSPSTPRTSTEAKLVLLESTVKTTPQSGAAWRDYASALYASGQKAQARAIVGRAKKSVTELDRTFPLLIELDQLWQEKEYERVVVKAKRAYTADQGFRKDYVAAKARNGVSIKDSDIPVKESIAILLYQARASGALKDWDGAVAALTTALQFDPLASDLLVLRADAYAKAGDKDKARADLETALSFIPGMPEALAGLESLEKSP